MRWKKLHKSAIIDDLSFRLEEGSYILLEDNNSFYICNRNYKMPNVRHFSLLSDYKVLDQNMLNFENMYHKETDSKVIKVTFNE